MRLSFSNIAWSSDNDAEVYHILEDYGFSGLEIAPTRIFSDRPYERIDEAKEWALNIKADYSFEISSMQSIWRGKNENLFGDSREREILLDYTKKSIDFAEAIGCHNLVFGCPKNRIISPDTDEHLIEDIFYTIGEYAYEHHTVFSLEPVCESYGTNFATHTAEAINIVKKVNNPGFRVNLDLGTMISNDESPDILIGNVQFINHVHISEPGLKAIRRRKIHSEIIRTMVSGGYDKYISVETGSVDDISTIDQICNYIVSLNA